MASTSTVYKYRIYCYDESGWIEGFGTDEPTTCYTDTAHSVNAASAQEVERISNQQVEIIEEHDPTQGKLCRRMLAFNYAANTTTYGVIQWPVKTSPLVVAYFSKAAQEGDYFQMIVGNENTITGILTASFTDPGAWSAQNYVVDDVVRYQTTDPEGNTVNYRYKCILNTVSNEVPTNTTYWTKENTELSVSPTVATADPRGILGYEYRITDGVNADTVGRVISYTSDKLYVEHSPTNSYSAASPTYVQMTIRVIKDEEMPGIDGQFNIGVSKIGATSVPANTPVYVKYTEVNGNTGRFRGVVEFLR